jgi:WD40 repeat protein
VASEKEIRSFSGDDSVGCKAAWSPDGKTLAGSSTSGKINLWDAATGKEIRSFSAAKEDDVNQIAWSPDGKTLATASDKTIRLWDPTTGKEIRSWSLDEHGIYHLAWSPDGKTLASAGSDHTIHLWDPATGKEIDPRPAHGSTVKYVTWSPDGTTLATATEGGTLHLWDAATGKQIRTCAGTTGHYISSLAWSPDGKTLASVGMDKTLHLWDPMTGKEIRSCSGHKDAVWDVAWSPDSKGLATASFDGTVRLWDAATGKEIRILSEHHGRVCTIAWSPDGKIVASASKDDTIHLSDPTTGKELRSCLAASVCDLAWSPDSRTLASAGTDGTTRLWDAATGKEIRSCSGRGKAVAWSPDGRTLATEGKDKTISLLDSATGREIRSIAVKFSIRHIAFAPEGRRLIAATHEPWPDLVIWEVPPVSLAKSELAGADLARLWADLGAEDAAKAEAAVWTLVAGSEQAVAFIKEKIPAATPDPKLSKKLTKLIADLDTDEFEARETASAELAKLGLSAEPGLRKALGAAPSLEARRRIEALLEKSEWPGVPLQTWRALAVLERTGSNEARQVLEGLANGDPDAPLTQDAQAALDRLRKRQEGQAK